MATSADHYMMALSSANNVGAAWNAMAEKAAAEGKDAPIATTEVLAMAQVHATLALVQKLGEITGTGAPAQRLIIPGMTFNGGRPA